MCSILLVDVEKAEWPVRSDGPRCLRCDSAAWSGHRGARAGTSQMAVVAVDLVAYCSAHRDKFT